MGKKSNLKGVDRRQFVKGTGVGIASILASGVAPMAFAKTMREVTFTQSWIPNGGSAWIYTAAAKGYFKKRGIDIKISRGFGSVASAQAVGQGKFNFGISSAPTATLQTVKGIDLAYLACCSYSSSMGVVYLKSSGIKTPKDLEGKKCGSVVRSGEYPFLPIFAKNAGFDWSKVDVVQVDNKIRTGVMLQKQVDFISCFASSVVPGVVTKGYDVGTFLYDNYEMPFYGYMLVTQPSLVAKEKMLCEDVTEAIMEGIKYQILNHDEAAEIFFKAIPEAGMTAGKRKQFEAETDLYTHVQTRPEITETGLGSVDMSKYKQMVDMVMKNLGKPGDTAPDLSKIMHLDEMINNKIKISGKELVRIKELGAPGLKALG
jgi:NitT/TauT family transport system substrate-binding protein